MSSRGILFLKLSASKFKTKTKKTPNTNEKKTGLQFQDFLAPCNDSDDLVNGETVCIGTGSTTTVTADEPLNTNGKHVPVFSSCKLPKFSTFLPPFAPDSRLLVSQAVSTETIQVTPSFYSVVSSPYSSTITSSTYNNSPVTPYAPDTQLLVSQAVSTETIQVTPSFYSVVSSPYSSTITSSTYNNSPVTPYAPDTQLLVSQAVSTETIQVTGSTSFYSVVNSPYSSTVSSSTYDNSLVTPFAPDPRLLVSQAVSTETIPVTGSTSFYSVVNSPYNNSYLEGVDFNIGNDSNEAYMPDFDDSDEDYHSDGDITLSDLSSQVAGILHHTSYNSSYNLRNLRCVSTVEENAIDQNGLPDQNDNLNDERDTYLEENQPASLVKRGVMEGTEGNASTNKRISTNSVEKDVKQVVNSLLRSVVAAVDFSEGKKSKKRARTQEEMIVKNAARHPLLPACNCTYKCHEFINEERRIAIHDEFWTLSHDKQMAWVIATVDKESLTRARSLTQGQRVCTSTKKYYLKNDDGELKKVCAIMYRHTLGYAHDIFIRIIFSKVSDCKTLPSPDKRGRHEPKNKASNEEVEAVREHMSFNPTIAHYRRKHAPNRLYLSPELSISAMHAHYNKNTTKNVSYTFYHNIVSSLNISFARLGLEDCDDCEIQKQHVSNDHNNDEHLLEPDGVCIYPVKCATCIKFIEHEKTVKSVRIEYQKDVKNRSSSTDTGYYSADMQKVIMLPRIPGSKTCIFTKRMVTFHETFAPIGSFEKEKPVGVIWNESISGRNATDLASVFVHFMRTVQSKTNTRQFFIWADNCSGQNKNWTLFTALVAEVNRSSGPELIALKFFEPGHTFMSADAFHRIVEQRMKKVKNVYDFDEFVKIINYRGTALEMQYFNFISYPKGLSAGKYASEKPLLENVREVQFRKGSEKMFWRTSFGEELKSAIFLQKKYSREVIKGNIGYFQHKEAPRGFLSSKKKDIVDKLCDRMDTSKNKAYWMNLPESDTVLDLADK